jgi:hypothetical protein
MSRTRAAVALLLFALLALFPTAKVVAGPPGERSSAMQLDRVADGLRLHRQQKADDKRVAWLKRLAPSQDPRVKAALEAALSDSSGAVRGVAEELLAQHYGRVPPSCNFLRFLRCHLSRRLRHQHDPAARTRPDPLRPLPATPVQAPTVQGGSDSPSAGGPGTGHCFATRVTSKPKKARWSLTFRWSTFASTAYLLPWSS